jgi:hypothetical protein
MRLENNADEFVVHGHISDYRRFSMYFSPDIALIQPSEKPFDRRKEQM